LKRKREREREREREGERKRMSSVTVLFRGVRENVKVTPATTLGKILEDTCKKKNLPCDGLGFK